MWFRNGRDCQHCAPGFAGDFCDQHVTVPSVPGANPARFNGLSSATDKPVDLIGLGRPETGLPSERNATGDYQAVAANHSASVPTGNHPVDGNDSQVFARGGDNVIVLAGTELLSVNAGEWLSV